VHHHGNSTIEVYLATPYTYVWYTAAWASRKPDQFDKESLWSEVRDEKNVRLLVTTFRTVRSKHWSQSQTGPVIQRVGVRVPTGEQTPEYGPFSLSKVECGSAKHCQRSLGMNWGTLAEYPPDAFSGGADIEIVVVTPDYRAVIPVTRQRLLEIPENRLEQNAVP